MKRSTGKILTTHTGSLPRSPYLQELLLVKDERRQYDPEVFDAGVHEAVAEIVKRQLDIGLDVINDGEQSKPSYATYVKDRLTGFEGERLMRTWQRLDETDFPEWAEQSAPRITTSVPQPTCTGPIAWKDRAAVQKDIEYLKAAVERQPVEEVFMSAASPGVIAFFLPNEYFPREEDYLYALADVMKEEYNAIVQAGFLLQVDCPDLAMTRNSQFSHLSEAEFVKVAEMHLEVVNYAVAGIPPDRMRLHLCWGNYEGPHNHDIPLKQIVNLVLKARPEGLSFEAANPRHAHEWKVWEDVKLPDGKVLIPGVLDTTTNFVEHPELVAERIVRFARVVGRENVIAGTDCGFGTSAWRRRVDTRVAWAKLAAMVEGARLASQELW